MTLVVAGLLQVLYEFSTLGPGITADKRQQVANAIRNNVEYWLHYYSSVDWNNADIAALERDADRLPLPLAKLLLLRMANELEEYHDQCIQFSAKIPTTAHWLPLFTRVAALLGVADLAAELADTYQRSSTFVAPAALRSPQRAAHVLQNGKALPAAQRRAQLTLR